MSHTVVALVTDAALAGRGEQGRCSPAFAMDPTLLIKDDNLSACVKRPGMLVDAYGTV